MRRAASTVVLIAALVVVTGCPRRPPRRPPSRGAVPPAEPVASAISDVATGGSWEEGGRSGVHRIVVRSAGRRDVRSLVELQWLAWSEGQDQPVLVRSAAIGEIARSAVIVTNSRIEDEGGRTVVRLGIANAVTGAVGEARVWPTAVGAYRVRIKWAGDALSE